MKLFAEKVQLMFRYVMMEQDSPTAGLQLDVSAQPVPEVSARHFVNDMMNSLDQDCMYAGERFA